MSELPINNHNVEYNDYLRNTIEDIEVLINKEHKNSIYFERLLAQISDVSTANTIKNILNTSKEHCKTLKDIYLELTNKDFSCFHGFIHIDNSIKKALMWALLDKFQVVKIYNSLLENLTVAKHRAFVIKMISDEVAAVAELNDLLIDK
jgi:hypothetical protein